MTPQVSGLILASGMSQRFFGGNKLLALVDHVPIVKRTAEAFLSGGLAGVWIVVGHESELVVDAIAGLPLTVVRNPRFGEGQSRALVQGLQVLPETTDAAVIGVGDQPFLNGDVIRSLVKVYRGTRAPIVAPRYRGQRGNPVLFDRRVFAELLAVTGDQGGRPVIVRHADSIAWIDVEDARTGMDVDRVEDLERL